MDKLYETALNKRYDRGLHVILSEINEEFS